MGVAVLRMRAADQRKTEHNTGERRGKKIDGERSQNVLQEAYIYINDKLTVYPPFGVKLPKLPYHG
jgi:hypothetical protein